MGAFDHLEWTYDGAFEQLFDLGRGEFEQKFCKKYKCPGVAQGGMLKLQFDWYIIIKTIQFFGRGWVGLGDSPFFMCPLPPTQPPTEGRLWHDVTAYFLLLKFAVADLGEGPGGPGPPPILGKRRKKTQKEEQPAGQTKQKWALPLTPGLDPPLVYM